VLHHPIWLKRRLWYRVGRKEVLQGTGLYDNFASTLAELLIRMEAALAELAVDEVNEAEEDIDFVNDKGECDTPNTNGIYLMLTSRRGGYL
jgi:hypothetical protein